MQKLKVIDRSQDGVDHDQSLVDWAQLRRIMEFQDITLASLSRICAMPLSTLRKMFSGETEDPRLSSILPVCRALGASLDRLTGLAPKRDLEREEAVYDSTLMDNMRLQMEKAQKQQAADAAELDRLRKLILSESKTCGDAQARAAALEVNIAAREQAIRHLEAMYKRLRIVSYVLLGFSLVAAGIIMYLTWELAHLDQGMTARMYEELLRQ